MVISHNTEALRLGAAPRDIADPTDENLFTGFRVASAPEPYTGSRLVKGLLSLAAGRRREPKGDRR